MKKKGGAVIEVKNITKSYGSVKAVDGISFTLDGAGVYGLLGPNGAGKTTTMNIMTGCLAATEGTVTVDGKDIYEDAVAVKKRIGYLPEIPPVYPEMTPAEFLRFVAEAKGVKRALIAPQVQHALSAAGVADVKEKLIKTLSKGYRQRVGIAMALIGDPDVIILDEPTVGLDPLQIIEIRELIRELGEHHTVLLSSHILPEVSAVSDRIIILSHGHVAADDSTGALLGQMGSGATISLTVKGTVAQVRATLKGVEGVGKLKARSSGRKGYLDVTLHAKDGADEQLLERISEKLMEARLAVTRLEAQQNSLESVFLDLTDDADKTAEMENDGGEGDEDDSDL